MTAQAWEWGREPKVLLTQLLLSFTFLQTPAATGTAPPPVHKVSRKWGPGGHRVSRKWGPGRHRVSRKWGLGQPAAGRTRHWSPVIYPIFTNHHHMGKSGHTGKIRKAAESTADNPVSITHGTELPGHSTVGLADPRTGRLRGEEKPHLSGWWPMAPRGGPQRSGGKAPGALTTHWRGGRSTTREERLLLRGGEIGRPPAEGTARPAGVGGLWKGCWIREGLQSGGGGARLKGEQNRLTAGEQGPLSGGESGPLRKGTERTESAPEKKSRAWSRMPAEVAGMPPSREGGLTKNAAPTSVSELGVTFQPLPCQRFYEEGHKREII